MDGAEFGSVHVQAHTCLALILKRALTLTPEVRVHPDHRGEDGWSGAILVSTSIPQTCDLLHPLPGFFITNPP